MKSKTLRDCTPLTSSLAMRIPCFSIISLECFTAAFLLLPRKKCPVPKPSSLNSEK